MFKIISKPTDIFEVSIQGPDFYAYLIYVTDHNYRPIETVEVYGETERMEAVEKFIEKYGPDIDEIKHTKEFVDHVDI